MRAETGVNDADHHLTGQENGDRYGQLQSGRAARLSGADGAAEKRPPGDVPGRAAGPLEVQ